MRIVAAKLPSDSISELTEIAFRTDKTQPSSNMVFLLILLCAALDFFVFWVCLQISKLKRMCAVCLCFQSELGIKSQMNAGSTSFPIALLWNRWSCGCHILHVSLKQFTWPLTQLSVSRFLIWKGIYSS